MKHLEYRREVDKKSWFFLFTTHFVIFHTLVVFSQQLAYITIREYRYLQAMPVLRVIAATFLKAAFNWRESNPQPTHTGWPQDYPQAIPM